MTTENQEPDETDEQTTVMYSDSDGQALIFDADQFKKDVHSLLAIVAFKTLTKPGVALMKLSAENSPEYAQVVARDVARLFGPLILDDLSPSLNPFAMKNFQDLVAAYRIVRLNIENPK